MEDTAYTHLRKIRLARLINDFHKIFFSSSCSL